MFQGWSQIQLASFLHKLIIFNQKLNYIWFLTPIILNNIKLLENFNDPLFSDFNLNSSLVSSLHPEQAYYYYTHLSIFSIDLMGG